MKVKELIEMLQKQNPELEVVTYCELAEEFENPSNIEVIEDEETQPYSKCEYPSDNGIGFPYLLIQ